MKQFPHSERPSLQVNAPERDFQTASLVGLQVWTEAEGGSAGQVEDDDLEISFLDEMSYLPAKGDARQKCSCELGPWLSEPTHEEPGRRFRRGTPPKQTVSR